MFALRTMVLLVAIARVNPISLANAVDEEAAFVNGDSCTDGDGVVLLQTEFHTSRHGIEENLHPAVALADVASAADSAVAEKTLHPDMDPLLPRSSIFSSLSMTPVSLLDSTADGEQASDRQLPWNHGFDGHTTLEQLLFEPWRRWEMLSLGSMLVILIFWQVFYAAPPTPKAHATRTCIVTKDKIAAERAFNEAISLSMCYGDLV
mmetsp:Transcript_77935/g.167250  ORF Transcript_77935/g.167250 Transcript_77935/m.167250 type:complete len:206 (+) Transcript_77935:63-680(+)